MQPNDRGWIKTPLEEAENERMHLKYSLKWHNLTCLKGWKSIGPIRILALLFHSLCVFPKTAHRTVGYFEDQAVVSYTQLLEEIEKGNTSNIKAPRIAIDY